MQDTVLERLLVVDYMTDIWIRNLQNFVVKLVPEVEICWKKWDLWPHFLITLKINVFCWDQYNFSESLGCKLTENYDGFKNISLFFRRILKQSKKVWQPTCLETNFILILNFPQISAKYAPKYQKRIIFYEFKQFWWIWSFMPMSSHTRVAPNYLSKV
jgi:hypothetical protein